MHCRRAVFLLTAAAAILTAQFEAASIKRNRSGTTMMGVRQLSHGRLVTENTPLSFLIGVAYKRRLAWFDISSGPAWISSDGYDVTAAAKGDLANEQMYPLLQALLKDRFQLKLHRETKELPVYALMPAKSGLKLQNAKPGNCSEGDPASAPPRALPCGNIAVSLSPLGLQLRGGSTNMQSLATALAGVLGKTVIDKTGFTGTFDVDVEFTPDEALAGIPRPGSPGALPSPPPSGDHAGPSLFVALQERAGLKLESTKGPATVFVIDHVERPSEN